VKNHGMKCLRAAMISSHQMDAKDTPTPAELAKSYTEFLTGTLGDAALNRMIVGSKHARLKVTALSRMHLRKVEQALVNTCLVLAQKEAEHQKRKSITKEDLDAAIARLRPHLY
jgi:histone H3/H4